ALSFRTAAAAARAVVVGGLPAARRASSLALRAHLLGALGQGLYELGRHAAQSSALPDDDLEGLARLLVLQGQLVARGVNGDYLPGDARERARDDLLRLEGGAFRRALARRAQLVARAYVREGRGLRVRDA